MSRSDSNYPSISKSDDQSVAESYEFNNYVVKRSDTEKTISSISRADAQSCLNDAAAILHESLSENTREIIKDNSQYSESQISQYNIGYYTDEVNLITRLRDRGHAYGTIVATVGESPVIDHLFSCTGVHPMADITAPEEMYDYTCGHNNLPKNLSRLKAAVETDTIQIETISFKNLFRWLSSTGWLTDDDSSRVTIPWTDHIIVPYTRESGDVSNLFAQPTENVNGYGYQNNIANRTNDRTPLFTIETVGDTPVMTPPGAVVSQDTTLQIENTTDYTLTITEYTDPDDQNTVSESVEIAPHGGGDSSTYEPAVDGGYHYWLIENQAADIAIPFAVLAFDSYGSRNRYTNMEEWLTPAPNYTQSFSATGPLNFTHEWKQPPTETPTHLYMSPDFTETNTAILTESLSDAQYLNEIGYPTASFGTANPSTEQLRELITTVTESTNINFVINTPPRDHSNQYKRRAGMVTTLLEERISDASVTVSDIGTPDSIHGTRTLKQYLTEQAKTVSGQQDALRKQLVDDTKAAVGHTIPYVQQLLPPIRDLTVEDVNLRKRSRLTQANLDDYKVELHDDDIRDHYLNTFKPVSQALAQIGTDDSGPVTPGAMATSGWYLTTERTPVDAVNSDYSSKKFDKKKRPRHLSKDLRSMASEVDKRTIHALTTYKEPQSVTDGWVPATYTRKGTQYTKTEGKPVPEKEDIRGWSVWVDIDLVDELKPQRGQLDPDTRDRFEQGLTEFATRVAEQFYDGNHEAVFGVDSIGGAYVLGPPAAVQPLVEHIRTHPEIEKSDDAIRLLVDHIRKHEQQILEDIITTVEDTVSGLSDVWNPDVVNNHNRKYKCPLSIHKSHPGIATPIDITDPDYQFTHITDITDSHVQTAVDWANSLTDTSHQQYAPTVATALWDDADTDTWRETLTEWVQEELNREAKMDQTHDYDLSDINSDEITVTPDLREVNRALNTFGVEIAEKTIIDQWTDNASGYDANNTAYDSTNKRDFIPVWAANASSGTANYIREDDEKVIWYDSGNGVGGGPKTMAIQAKYVDDNDKPDEPQVDTLDELEPEQKREAVSRIRHEHGFETEIPIWIPDATTHTNKSYERTPYWAVVKAAKELGIVDEDTIDATGEFKKIPPTALETTIEELRERGLEVGDWNVDDS